jgi:hypothetical protein
MRWWHAMPANNPKTHAVTLFCIENRVRSPPCLCHALIAAANRMQCLNIYNRTASARHLAVEQGPALLKHIVQYRLQSSHMTWQEEVYLVAAPRYSPVSAFVMRQSLRVVSRPSSAKYVSSRTRSPLRHHAAATAR